MAKTSQDILESIQPALDGFSPKVKNDSNQLYRVEIRGKDRNAMREKIHQALDALKEKYKTSHVDTKFLTNVSWVGKLGKKMKVGEKPNSEPYKEGSYYTGKEHSFFDEAEEKMVGVIVYGDPIGRLTGQSISDEIKRTEVLELTRLFIHDGYGSNIESWFISQSFNWLRKNKSEIKALISYASPVEGHSGTIYQATNWIYQGNNNRWNDGWIFRFEEDGRWIHGRTIFPYYKTNDPKEIQKQVDKPCLLYTSPSPRDRG